MSGFSNWPHRWFGFFSETPDGDPEAAWIEDFVDTAWDVTERDLVISYLSESPVVVAGCLPSKKCLLCDLQVPSATFKSDGVWLWPQNLLHMVEKHGIRVPREFVEHMRASSFTAPARCEESLEMLPWP